MNFVRASLAIVLLWAVLPVSALAAPVDHSLLGGLLEAYLEDGYVDYQGLKSEEQVLDTYLERMSSVDPGDLSGDEALAYYINVYNAGTIKLILEHYPVQSIKDIGSWFRSPWKIEFIKLQDETVHLDYIEHEIIRPTYRDPRIHFAVNCASKSCPPLRGEPYIGARIHTQLDEQTRDFVNDPAANHVKGGTLYVSSIFDWYREDFPDDLIGFFMTYAGPDLAAALRAHGDDIDIEYLDYDWSLNGR